MTVANAGFREGLVEPGGRPAQPVEEIDARPPAEQLGGHVDAARVAQDVADPGRAPVDRQSSCPTARSIVAASSLTVVSRPVPTWKSSPATRSSGRLEGGEERGGEVVDVDEVARLLAVAVDRERRAGERGAQPRRDDALLVERSRAVGVGEAEGARGDPVRRGVGRDVRLAGELRGPVGRDGRGRTVSSAGGSWCPQDRVRAGEDEPPDARRGGPPRGGRPSG